MPFNGSGSFSVYTPGNPVVTGTVISSTVTNNTNTDFASGLTNCVTKDGQTTPTANLPMGGFKLTGMGVGSAATDSARLSQVQSAVSQLIGSISGTDTITGAMSPALTAYAAGQEFKFVSAGANTGAVTLNIDSLGAKAVTKNGTTALAAGDIPSGAMVHVTYDGTRFQVTSVALASGSITTSGYTMTTARLLGRTTASTGAIEEISAGAGITLSGGSISAAAEATQAEVNAGTSTTTYLSPAKNRVFLGTEVTTTGGTTLEVITSIASGWRRVTIPIASLSTNGTSNLLVQLGDAGGYETSGYLSRSANSAGSGAGSTAGFIVTAANFVAGSSLSGTIVLTCENSSDFTVTCTAVLADTVANDIYTGAGTKATSQEMTSVRLTMVNGTDTFDAIKLNATVER